MRFGFLLGLYAWHLARMPVLVVMKSAARHIAADMMRMVTMLIPQQIRLAVRHTQEGVLATSPFGPVRIQSAEQPIPGAVSATIVLTFILIILVVRVTHPAV